MKKQRHIPVLNKYREIYFRNLAESIIPFWQKNSPDLDHGGTFSCFDRHGQVYDSKKYTWMVARSAWMFARLYNEFESKQEYLKIAELGIECLQRYARDGQGRYYFSLTREGDPWFYQRKPYGAVFAMMAYLEYFRASGLELYRQEAIDLFWKIHQWISDPAVKVLMENVAEDPEQKIMQWPEGRLFNPGHSIEVAWFIMYLMDHVEDRDMFTLALEVLQGSLEFGWDERHGGIYYFMDVEAKPTLQLESSMKLWWPHTEAIYALVLAFCKTGESRWLEWLDKVNHYAFSHFVDAEYGTWFGYCDRRGNLTHASKGSHYKGFFHAPRALLFSIQEIDRYVTKD